MSFKLPQIYDFPPFFTKQPNEQTWIAQRSQWIQLILDYSRANKIWILNNKGKVISQGEVDSETNDEIQEIGNNEEVTKDSIFNNSKINRKLDFSTIDDIFKQMILKGDANYVSKRDSSTIYINWNRPEDWASMILEWVERTGQTGSVLTLYEISQGDLSESEEFHGIHPKVLENALLKLVARGRAQILKGEIGEIAGVKIQ